MNEKKYIIILALLLILSEFGYNEILFFLCIIYIILTFIVHGINIRLLKYLSPFLCVTLIGLIMGLVNYRINDGSKLDYVRDIYFFLKPFIFIAFAYCLGYYKKLKINIIYKSFILSALVISTWHYVSIIYSFIIYKNFVRGVGGAESIITCIALYILVFHNKNKDKKQFMLAFYFLFSILLYLSRTSIGVLLITVIAYIIDVLRKRNINVKKGLISFLFVISILTVFYNVIPKPQFNYALEKLTNSWEEISSNSSSWNQQNINDNWRGYEVYIAKREIKDTFFIDKIVGFGFGKRIRLDTMYGLGGDFDSIPILHNGYYYIIIKTGFLGVALYICFFFILIVHSLKGFKVNKEIKKDIFFICVTELFLTIIVTGLYGTTGVLPISFMLGYLYALDQNKIVKTEV